MASEAKPDCTVQSLHHPGGAQQEGAHGVALAVAVLKLKMCPSLSC